MTAKGRPLDLPLLASGPGIRLKREEQLILNCPKCNNRMDVSGVHVGQNIQCPACKNMTWVPKMKPRWWQSLPAFLVSVVVSFVIGVGASLTATSIYSNAQDRKESQSPETQPAAVVPRVELSREGERDGY